MRVEDGDLSGLVVLAKELLACLCEDIAHHCSDHGGALCLQASPPGAVA